MASHRSAAPPARHRFVIYLVIAAVALGLLPVALTARVQASGVVAPPIAEDVAIVVSPHPDDETYSMGQTIASQVLSGKKVIGVLVTDGESSQLVGQWAAEHGTDLNDDGSVDKWDFALARRQEYREAMSILGVDELVFLGTADTQGAKGLADTDVDAGALQERLSNLAESNPGATWFTTAPFNWKRFYRGDFRNHPDHARTAEAVRTSAESSDGVVYMGKTYVYYLPSFLRLAPMKVAGTGDALSLKRSAIEAFSTVGAMSTPELYEASMRDSFEYLVPAAD